MSRAARHVYQRSSCALIERIASARQDLARTDQARVFAIAEALARRSEQSLGRGWWGNKPRAKRRTPPPHRCRKWRSPAELQPLRTYSHSGASRIMNAARGRVDITGANGRTPRAMCFTKALVRSFFPAPICPASLSACPNAVSPSSRTGVSSSIMLAVRR